MSRFISWLFHSKDARDDLTLEVIRQTFGFRWYQIRDITLAESVNWQKVERHLDKNLEEVLDLILDDDDDVSYALYPVLEKNKPTVIFACSSHSAKLKFDEAIEIQQEYVKSNGFPGGVRTWFWDGGPKLGAAIATADSRGIAELNTNIGGVILIDGEAFGLTSAHGAYVTRATGKRNRRNRVRSVTSKTETSRDERSDSLQSIHDQGKAWEGTDSKAINNAQRNFTTLPGDNFGEVSCYRFGSLGYQLPAQQFSADSRSRNSVSDWALVRLTADTLPASALRTQWITWAQPDPEKPSFETYERSTDADELAIWGDAGGTATGAVLVESVLPEFEESKVARMPCIVTTSRSVIKGLVSPLRTTFNAYRRSFAVLRIDLESELSKCLL